MVYKRLSIVGEKNHAWTGGRFVNSAGYVEVWMPDHPRATHKGYAREHVVLAERALGKPLPFGAVVHHVDNDRCNNQCNLVICQDEAYHRLLHARARIVKAGGRPGVHKICGLCRLVLPLGEFTTVSGEAWGRHKYCRPCRNHKTRAQRQRARMRMEVVNG